MAIIQRDVAEDRPQSHAWTGWSWAGDKPIPALPGITQATPPQKSAPSLALPRRQHHDHLASLETGVHLDLGEFLGVALDPFEQPGAEFLVGHFAAAKP